MFQVALRTALALILTAGLLSPADAQSDAPPDDPRADEPRSDERRSDEKQASFRRDRQRADALRKGEQWDSALTIYERLLEAHRGRDYVRAARAEIEEGLKVCRFMASYEEPGGKELFGPGCTEYRPRTGSVELHYRRVPHDLRDSRSWEVDGSLFAFKHRLSRSVELTFTMSSLDFARPGEAAPMILLGWDRDREHGLAVVPGFKTDRFSLAHQILKIDEGGTEKVWTSGGSHGPYRVRVSGGRIQYNSGRVKSGRRALRGVNDGYLLLLRPSFKGFSIDGRIEPKYHQTLQRRHQTEAYRRWTESWERAEQLPRWLIEPTAPATGPSRSMSFPGVESESLRRRLQGMVEAHHAGDTDVIRRTLSLVSDRWEIPDATRHYLLGLDAVGRDGRQSLRACVLALDASAPEFGPGHALRGWLHLEDRHPEKARASLAAAEEAAPDDPLTVILGLRIAIGDRDLEGAEKIFAHAKRRGIEFHGRDEWAAVVKRAIRGPSWPKKNVVVRDSVRVESDHSKRMCREVASELSRTMDVIAKHFPTIPSETRTPPTVRVFSSRKDYVAYSADVGHDLLHTAGAYLPLTREVVIWIPRGSKEFRDTVRHEGFHWYLHELVEAPPAWFDEGHAQWFGSVSRKFGITRAGATSGGAVRALARFYDSLTPIGELMTMDRAEFMRKPMLHYAQSWALVHLLRETAPAKLDRYLEAIQAGTSREDAYRIVFVTGEGVGKLRAQYRRHIRRLIREEK